MASKQIIFRDTYLVDYFEGRKGHANTDAQTAIYRYLNILKRASRGVNLTVGEAYLLCDVGNGTFWNWFEITPDAFYSDVEYAIQEEGLAEKWEVDEELFLERLRELSVCQWAAIVTAIEEFWNGESTPALLYEAFKLLLSYDARSVLKDKIAQELTTEEPYGS